MECAWLLGPRGRLSLVVSILMIGAGCGAANEPAESDEEVPAERSMSAPADDEQPESGAVTPPREASDDRPEPVIEPDPEVALEPDTRPVELLDGILADAAIHTCRLLTSCCQGDDAELYFAGYAQLDSIGQLVDRIPPSAPLDMETCPGVLLDLWSIRPFGSWREALEAGRVELDAAGAMSCMAEVEATICGERARDVLFDGSCFGLQPGFGPDGQRRMFARDSVAGDACAPIIDGFGTMVYGSCNPLEDFCCVPTPSGQGCAPFPAADSVGQCRPVSQPGDACGIGPDVSYCATGIECNDSGTCEAPDPTPLPVGAECDGLINTCDHGYCSFEGVCEPFLGAGEPCFFPSECGGALTCVDGACGPNTLCSGT